MKARRFTAPAGTPAAQQMQQLSRMMPLMYLLFGFALPAGLNVYFLTSSAFRLGQQALIHRMDHSSHLDVGSTETTGESQKAPPQRSAHRQKKKSNKKRR